MLVSGGRKLLACALAVVLTANAAAPALAEFAEGPGLGANARPAAPAPHPPYSPAVRIQPAVRLPGRLADSPRYLESPKDKADRENVAKDLGPIVEENDAPVLYKTVRQLFERLSEAQRKMVPSDILVINGIFIADSPINNAFVLQRKEAGIRRSRNMVFVTTGLLKKLFDGATPGQLLAGQAGLAGVLSHELAHPLDRLDGDSLKKNYHAAARDQAVEIRADAEGMMIAKEAGYPAESVYSGLSKILEPDEDSSAARSAFSTHPQNDLRLGAQRMLLTLDRYEKGTHSPRYPEAASASVFLELKALDKGRRLWRFVAPLSLSEAFERLRQVPDSDKSYEFKVVEFNRLLLTIDQQLQRKDELTPVEWEQFIKHNEFLAKLKEGNYQPVAPLDRQGMNKFFTADTESLEFLRHPPHSTYLKRIPAYRSARHVEWVKANVLAKPAGATRGRRDYMDYFDDSIRALARVLAPELVFGHFEERLAEGMLALLNASDWPRMYYEHALRGRVSEWHVRMARLFVGKILPWLSRASQVEFFIDSGHGQDSSYVLPQFQEKDAGAGILTSRHELMLDPAKKELQETCRAVFAALWERKGYFGALDLIGREKTDWELMFAALGLDKDVAYGHLRRAVKEFAKSAGYAELVGVVEAAETRWLRNVKTGTATMDHSLPWIDSTLAPYLAGDFNEAVKADARLRKTARSVFARNYLNRQPEVFRAYYAGQFREALEREAGRGITAAGLKAIHEGILENLSGPRAVAPVQDIQAALLDRSGLSQANKKSLLKAVFVEGHDEAGTSEGLFGPAPWHWLSHEDDDYNKAVMAVLLKNGVVDSASTFFGLMLKEPRDLETARKENFRSYFLGLRSFNDELAADLRLRLTAASSDRQKLSVLADFAEEILDPNHGAYGKEGLGNTKGLRELKERIVEWAEPLKASGDDEFRLFYALTGGGPTPATDDLYVKRLEARHQAAFDSRSHKRLAMVLRNKRIHGSALQLRLAQRLLKPEVLELERRAYDTRALEGLIARANDYVPSGSLKKDEWLESLAWRLQIEGLPLSTLIEDEKSYNWKKANPLLVNLGSAVSAELTKANVRTRHAFIEFILDPQHKELPPALFAALTRQMEKELEQHKTTSGSVFQGMSDEELKREAREGALRAKLRVESAMMDATPFERIPLLEQVISGGRKSLAAEPDYPYNLTRGYLKYAPNSVEERMLVAFLSVVPEHERPVSLAYLLSQAGENKSSLKDIFEVFQAVGIKFGQLSSTWKLFGEAAARETASLKTDARPSSRAEILSALERELSSDERSRIKRVKRILGSASLKTVALVELEGGSEAVVLFRRPHAAAQVEANLNLSAAFLRELKRQGVAMPAPMLDSLLESVKAQLGRELKMTGEAERLAAAAAVYERLNRELGRELSGWRFSVPRLAAGFKVRDDIAFLQKAEGTTFEKLSPRARAEVGPILVGSALASLFRYGWFDADRHVGNQLIDEKTKTIYPIDFGQAEVLSRKFWGADERYVAAQFIRAMGERDVDAVLRFGLRMSGAKDLPSGRKEALRGALAEVMAAPRGPADALIAVTGAFAGNGAAFEGKFTAGVLKGLMTLYGEGYVPKARFNELLRREIKRLLTRKLPLTVLDGFQF